MYAGRNMQSAATCFAREVSQVVLARLLEDSKCREMVAFGSERPFSPRLLPEMQINTLLDISKEDKSREMQLEC